MQRKMMVVAAAMVGLMLSVVVAQAAVELLYFTGIWTDDGSLLAWGTESEQDSLGFNIWRSTENIQVVNGTLNTSQAVKINPTFIPGVNGGCDPLNGDDYTYTDTTADPNEDAYYYFIESQNCGPGSVFYGDNGNTDGPGVLVIPGASQRLYLPIVVK